MKENLVEQIIKMADRYDDYMDYRCIPIKFLKVKNKDRYSCLRFVFGSYDSVLFEVKSAENSYFSAKEKYISFSKENIYMKDNLGFYYDQNNVINKNLAKYILILLDYFLLSECLHYELL